MKKFVSSLLVMTFCLSLTAGCVDISAIERSGGLPTPTGFVVWDGVIYPMSDEELALFERNPLAFEFYKESQPVAQPTPNASRSYYLSDIGYPKTYLDSTYQDYITPCYGGGPYGTEVTTQMGFSQTDSYTAGGNLTTSYKK